MKKVIHKLLMGKGHPEGQEFVSTVDKRVENIKAIWNNEYEEDAGLEKLLRLVLAASQFLFAGMYVKHLFWKKGPLYQDLATEIFVLLKTAFPLWLLYTGRQNDPWLYALMIWFLLETVMYIPTLIFASDTFSTPRSYRRGTLLLLLNYLEVVLAFAVIYAAGQHLNLPLTHWAEAVYFSFSTSSTIGFGDFYPVTNTGRMLVVLQSLFYLSYIVLFINFFNLRMKRGYFRDDSKRDPG
ncbi:MAG: potassium channel family protein [Flavobacteriales bacterium]